MREALHDIACQCDNVKRPLEVRVSCEISPAVLSVTETAIKNKKQSNSRTIHTFHTLDTLTLLHTIVVYSQKCIHQPNRVSPTLKLLTIGIIQFFDKALGEIVGIHYYSGTFDNDQISIRVTFFVKYVQPKEMMLLNIEVLGGNQESLVCSK